MFRLGIDLGGTNISVGVVDSDSYEIKGSAKEKTRLPASAEETVEAVYNTALKAVSNAGLSLKDIAFAGVGTPGAVNLSGYVDFSSSLGFKKLRLQDMLEEKFSKPVRIENDANCAAIGEYRAGCGDNVRNFIALTVGTGIGAGIFVNGKLLTGVNGAAGEIGHIVIKKDGIRCPCGRRGCFEQYASATALKRQTRQALLEDLQHASLMWELIDGNIDRISGRTAFDAAKRGDIIAKEVVDSYICYLACGVTSLINIFQPEILCVGGGVSNEGDNLIVPLCEYVRRERYTKFSKRQTKIRTASLGNNAGIIGAALLADSD